jgi:hypothetical protein
VEVIVNSPIQEVTRSAEKSSSRIIKTGDLSLILMLLRVILWRFFVAFGSFSSGFTPC